MTDTSKKLCVKISTLSIFELIILGQSEEIYTVWYNTVNYSCKYKQNPINTHLH